MRAPQFTYRYRYQITELFFGEIRRRAIDHSKIVWTKKKGFNIPGIILGKCKNGDIYKLYSFTRYPYFFYADEWDIFPDNELVEICILDETNTIPMEKLNEEQDTIIGIDNVHVCAGECCQCKPRRDISG